MHTLSQLRSGALNGAISIKLSEGLTHFPIELFELADTLEQLDLSGNEISYLPADFGRLKKLKTFFCSDNHFTKLPEVLADCPLDIVGFKANKIETIPPRALNPNLRWLILTNNCIQELPKEIGHCTRMQKLMLAGNQLADLPIELSRCLNLSLLRISANKLTTLPSWLLSMPRLSWLALSGNRFSKHADTPSLPYISWHEFDIHHVLGEGASGIILKAVRHTDPQKKEVAVKVFKGAVTSDGLPADEMNAFIAAGSHPGLVQLIAQISDHPHGKQGLIMEMIPERFYNLGLPPSLTTCTRDVFKYGQQLSLKQVLKIATTITSVAAHLHSIGIIHGDLYAHNILTDDDGNTLFTDFGAASFYDKADGDFERLEVSAFGYLLEDLLSLCSDISQPKILAQLGTIKDTCTAINIASRLCFLQLNSELKKLSDRVF